VTTFAFSFSSTCEKNIALAVVLKVGKNIETTPQMEVNYTRKNRCFIVVVERANVPIDSMQYICFHSL
jgi:N-acetylmuramoyl-L-alanine amidase